YGRVSPGMLVPDHLLSHSNSFGFEMEKDAAGCRALNRNIIVGVILEVVQDASAYSICCSQQAKSCPFIFAGSALML
ncbi:MAG TPA: hypothetical protein H9813_05150, partial [Candidatus Fournierella merdipullorum]|nr:hypothetical protein [Candidatus Fournierella merdipullorum]